MKRIHFHSFDAFRFFSFFIVFLHHVPHSPNSIYSYVSKSGSIGVSFFFVLSGFLITYILIHEKKTRNSISLKNFFARRILRIWPLYYAMIAFAFLTPYILNVLQLSSSNEGYTPNWLASICFLENYKMMLTESFPNVSPLRVMWSLCVEEHFYILWGLLLYILPIKQIPKLIVVSIIIANSTRLIFNHFNIANLDLFSNLDYFAYGAIPAYIFTSKKSVLDSIQSISRTLKYVILLATIIVVFSLPHSGSKFLGIISPTLLGGLFALIILFTLTTNGIHIKNKAILNKLGIYTYGLYLYHTIIINLLLQLFKQTAYANNTLVIAVTGLILTISVSIISYNIFEKQFLKLKRFFYS